MLKFPIQHFSSQYNTNCLQVVFFIHKNTKRRPLPSICIFLEQFQTNKMPKCQLGVFHEAFVIYCQFGGLNLHFERSFHFLCANNKDKMEIRAINCAFCWWNFNFHFWHPLRIMVIHAKIFMIRPTRRVYELKFNFNGPINFGQFNCNAHKNHKKGV